ncbi:homoserine kinase [Marinobacterium zhoushanense]|uniref:Homoserine kinase n=1 Tax=Marinobacterium zhoushanense TaxID=1679163 RepID=A0ABQ1K4T2_9GAMM|nr:phosphotransferase [Marinobacterium zhoushanense]GGB84451.1 homoserine kinase [Marinobacterium zhoushanense]
MSAFYQLTPEQQSQCLLQMAAQALSHWSLQDSELQLVKYRENAVYRVDTADGRRYALRIHRPGYHSGAALRSELQWMSALAENGIAVPEVIPTVDGRLLVSESHMAVPEARDIDLFAWIDGEQFGSVEQGLGDNAERIEHLYSTLGVMAARLHNGSSDWIPPAGFERHAWDRQGLVGEEPFWGRFWELELLTEEQKRLMESVRERIAEKLEGYDRSPQRYGLIHADFVPENLMVEGDTVRLIDFDDAGFGWHLFELATALYFIQEEPGFPVAKQALIDGYRRERALSDQELEDLELFLAARACTYLGWIRSRQETETARELAPELIRRACRQAERFLEIS